MVKYCSSEVAAAKVVARENSTAMEIVFVYFETVAFVVVVVDKE